MKATRGDYTLSCSEADQQAERIHAYLTRSYWANGISLELVKRSIAGSLCFGIFHQGEQVAFARVVTDRATFAYLGDVYVTVVAHPDLQGLRRFTLATRDAHGLYAKFGFAAPAQPEMLMEIAKPGLYLRQDVSENDAPLRAE
ncbi:MAG: GNAT family N-acetyltransferase [Verrucomicrobia bacterium]|nr:GNAT family N-acetyltransferase [Verrucomicrobiota bacterium]